MTTRNLCFALLLSALALPAWAQTDVQNDDQAADDQLVVQASAPVSPPAKAAQSGYGTLGQTGGGFGSALWARADGQAIERYLKILPETVLSPMTHELLRRALLTQAPAPQGTTEDDFLRARIAALLAIGDAGNAGALLRTVPANAAAAPLAQKVVNGEFYAADTENACLDVRSYAGKFGDAYWQRALVVCELAAGQKDVAQRDIAALPSDQFSNLATNVLNGNEAATSNALPGALEQALLRIGHMPFPASVLRSDDVVVMSGIARTDTFQPATRVEAGYAAAVQGGFGILDTLNLLRQPGAASSPPPGQTIARDDPTQSMAEDAHRDAALVATAEAADGSQKVDALRQMLTQDAETVDVPFLARVEYLRMQTMSGDRNALAPAAARGFLLEGDLPAASRWYDLSRDNPQASRIWPLGHIAYDAPETLRNDPALENWATKTIAADSEGGTKTVERVLAALSGLGETIPNNLWVKAIGKPDDEASIMGSMAISAMLAQAVQQNSKGEVIILVALSLKDGPGHAHPLNLNHAIAALWHVGMQNQAKAIALEGLAPVTQLGGEK